MNKIFCKLRYNQFVQVPLRNFGPKGKPAAGGAAGGAPAVEYKEPEPIPTNF